MKNNYFSYNLKFLRKSYNLSQHELAQIVGKTYSAVSLWERELREPSDKDINAFCNYFGLEPGDLMYRKLDEQTPSLLNANELELLALCKMLSSDKVKALIEIAKAMVG